MLPSPKVLLVLGLLAGTGSSARADRFAIGASVGATAGEGSTDLVDQATTIGVFGRLRLGSRLSLEVELSGVKSISSTDWDDASRKYGDEPSDAHHARLASAALRLDLADGTLRPHLLVGLGVENWIADSVDWTYAKAEVGAGIELALGSGLRLGLDLRSGRRELAATRYHGDIIAQFVYVRAPLTEAETGYVSTRLTLGASF